jgi:diacylglycerol kinase (ATP)
VVLGGARHRGGSFELLPDSVLDDGLFDVCAIEMPSPTRFGELFVAVAGGCHLGEPEVTYARGHNVVIEATGDEAVPVEYDGDLMAGALPAGQSVTFEVVGGALTAWAADPPAG